MPNEIAGIDKDFLYGRYQSQEDKRIASRERLGLKMAYKALDIPEEDDVNINVENTHHHYPVPTPPVAQVIPPVPKPSMSGLGTLAKLAIGAGLLGTGGGLAIGLPLLLDALKPKPPVVIHDPGEVKTVIKQGRANVVDKPARIVHQGE